MAGGPTYVVQVTDEHTGIPIYRWQGEAADEHEALRIATRELGAERDQQPQGRQ
jgi:hypothetical protein